MASDPAVSGQPEADPTDAQAVLLRVFDRLDARDWDGFADLLDPDLQVEWPHTGERLDRDGLVRVNREYPGRWRLSVEQSIGDGDRAAAHARVTGGTAAFSVASFARVRDGRVVHLVEVWADEAGEVPADRRPAP